ncbi:MAG: murein hydrolase activator EnvC family protein [Gemmiger sp.]|uniref:murein hydrolase activator EnvC family protein n=1 Tax=Subdoligranulum variabile TaxID=214851 RepID=UPI0026ECB8A9|nr:M23 family metallopeptidase [Subdoligranulum variabile]
MIKKAVSLALSVAMVVALTVSTNTMTLADDKKSELQAQKEQAQQELEAIQQQIKENEANKANAEELKEQYEQQTEVITNQIGLLQQSIAQVEQDINTKQLEIEGKQKEVDIKQAEYDERWAGFKDRLGAMQMLNDGGSIALLSSASSLYQLLTFAESLEQISSKDKEICQQIEAERQELEAQRTELENAKAELESQQAELQNQNNQLDSKKSELQVSIQQQDQTISEADAAAAVLEAEEEQARKNLDAAAAQLDAYLNSQVDKYSDAALTCSLNFGPALPTYKYISCVFGTGGHRGTDFAAPGGTEIYAVADGIVTDATYHYSWGNYVQIYHGKDDEGNTYSTLYAHMISTPIVSAGQTVTKGQVIGYVGSTGYSTGNHLHLEMKINGVLVNAANWIPH